MESEFEAVSAEAPAISMNGSAGEGGNVTAIGVEFMETEGDAVESIENPLDGIPNNSNIAASTKPAPSRNNSSEEETGELMDEALVEDIVPKLPEEELDEEEDESEDLTGEAAEKPAAARQPTQVPKKRRHVAIEREKDEEAATADLEAGTDTANAEAEEQTEDETDEEQEKEEEEDENDSEEVPLQKKSKRIEKQLKELAAAKEEEEEAEEQDKAPQNDAERAHNEDADETDEEELPTSSKRAAAVKENSVDENQCRVCTSKEDLVSLFKRVAGTQEVADLIMLLCPSVNIALKDFMPQYICNGCLAKVNMAVELKQQCEETERELRKKLSRSKNKVRRPKGYVVIDAPLESDPPTEEEEAKDDEFKVSDTEVSASVDDDSDFGPSSRKKRAVSRAVGRGGRRGGRRRGAANATVTAPVLKKRAGRGRGGARASAGRRKASESADAAELDDSDEVELPEPFAAVLSSAEEDLERTPSRKIKKKKNKSKKSEVEDPIQKEYPCDVCGQVFNRNLSLTLHKKAHSAERQNPISCELCGRQFKIRGAYQTHLEKHKEEKAANQQHNCSKCTKTFLNKKELRMHVSEEHEEEAKYYTCQKCKRVFTTETRLERHKDKCSGYEVRRKGDYESVTTGKELFKSVAPLKTTYWSDSFSE